MELQRNLLEPVDGPFLNSLSLRYLDLSHNKITYLSPYFFTNCVGVIKLDLSDNPFSTLEPESFEPLSILEVLKLNRCNLTYLPDNIFSNLTGLCVLELADNYLSTVDWRIVLGNLVRLEHLCVRNCNITSLPNDVFNNNPFMRNLILAKNDIKELGIVHALCQNLRKLDYLDVSNCNLQGPIHSKISIKNTKLRTLFLSGNRVTANDLSQVLVPLTDLHQLSLRNCGLVRLPSNTFEHLKFLEVLDISYNPLNNVFTELLAPLEKLWYLDMSYSNLSHISKDTFAHLVDLRQLILSGNLLTDLEYGLFQNLTKLKILELDNCGLKHPPHAKLFVHNHSYASLKHLSLSGNPLVIPENEPLLPEQLSGITFLDISHCNITKFHPGVFSSTPNITHLSLSGNNLSLISKADGSTLKFLETLPLLEGLDLSDCELTYITSKYFEHNPNIKGLMLTGNPWKCHCHIADMWKWAGTLKGDLGVLIGSVMSHEDITMGGEKRQKRLTCHYDPTEVPLSTMLRIKDFSFSRTWAKFIKEMLSISKDYTSLLVIGLFSLPAPLIIACMILKTNGEDLTGGQTPSESSEILTKTD